ncbi:unnamed protein product [Brassica rapa subsp. narinosa]
MASCTIEEVASSCNAVRLISPKMKNFEGLFSTELQPMSRASNKGSCRT